MSNNKAILAAASASLGLLSGVVAGRLVFKLTRRLADMPHDHILNTAHTKKRFQTVFTTPS